MSSFTSSTSSTLPSIVNLDVHFNPDGWGPIVGDKINFYFTTTDIPYTHFDKKEKFGKPADFVQASYQQSHQRALTSSQLYYQRKREEQILSNNDFSFKHDAIEDNTFQLVDTSKSQSKGRYSNIGMYSYSLIHYCPFIYTYHLPIKIICIYDLPMSSTHS
jgi:hypothetical protein